MKEGFRHNGPIFLILDVLLLIFIININRFKTVKVHYSGSFISSCTFYKSHITNITFTRIINGFIIGVIEN